MSRVIKLISGRSCPSDDAICLHAFWTGPGEHVQNIRLSCYGAAGGDNAIDQPGECNWYGFSLPFQAAVLRDTFSTTPGAIGTLNGTDSFDNLFESTVRTSDLANNDIYWGGDEDADLAEGEESGELDASSPQLDEPPIATDFWFSREVLTHPLAAEGNTVIRFGDEFSTSLRRFSTPKMGAMNMFGVMRSEISALTNFVAELSSDSIEELIGLIMTGRYGRVQQILQTDTSVRGDLARQMLLGGDAYIEASTLQASAMKFYSKAVVRISGSLSRWKN